MEAIDLYHNGFIRSIRENPEEDFARLVYADWLTERGEALGDFIRAQCAESQKEPLLPLPNHVQRWQQWHRQLVAIRHVVEDVKSDEEAIVRSARRLGLPDQSEGEKLALKQEGSWVGPLPDILPRWQERRIYRRGFIEHLELMASEWLQHRDLLRQWCPILRSVTINTIQEKVEALAACSLLADIPEVHLDARCPSLMRDELIPNFSWHDNYNYFDLSDPDWNALLNWPHSHQALFLRLGASDCANNRLPQLAGAPMLKHVAKLDLMGSDFLGVTDEDLKRLVKQVHEILGKPICQVREWDMG